jgi:hypothetical protein
MAVQLDGGLTRSPRRSGRDEATHVEGLLAREHEVDGAGDLVREHGEGVGFPVLRSSRRKKRWPSVF